MTRCMAGIGGLLQTGMARGEVGGDVARASARSARAAEVSAAWTSHASFQFFSQMLCVQVFVAILLVLLTIRLCRGRRPGTSVETQYDLRDVVSDPDTRRSIEARLESIFDIMVVDKARIYLTRLGFARLTTKQQVTAACVRARMMQIQTGGATEIFDASSV